MMIPNNSPHPDVDFHLREFLFLDTRFLLLSFVPGRENPRAAQQVICQGIQDYFEGAHQKFEKISIFHRGFEKSYEKVVFDLATARNQKIALGFTAIKDLNSPFSKIPRELTLKILQMLTATAFPTVSAFQIKIYKEIGIHADVVLLKKKFTEYEEKVESLANLYICTIL